MAIPLDAQDEPFDPADPIMISALEHWLYCQRQCGLIHVDQTFDENIYTLRGRYAHTRADQPGNEARRGARIERALPLWSRQLGLVGKADTVEFVDGVPYPVEYKVGTRRSGNSEDLQLCAQALCLEEMIGIPVPRGAIYYHASRKRHEVEFTEELRGAVRKAIQGIRKMLDDGRLPPAPNDARCRKCSLVDSCLPGVVSPGSIGPSYRRLVFEVEDGD